MLDIHQVFKLAKENWPSTDINEITESTKNIYIFFPVVMANLQHNIFPILLNCRQILTGFYAKYSPDIQVY